MGSFNNATKEYSDRRTNKNGDVGIIKLMIPAGDPSEQEGLPSSNVKDRQTNVRCELLKGMLCIFMYILDSSMKEPVVSPYLPYYRAAMRNLRQHKKQNCLGKDETDLDTLKALETQTLRSWNCLGKKKSIA